MRAIRLGVNIDHVATLARLRDTKYPDLLDAAKEVIAGGADQITVHLREDRRHIVDRNVLDLKKAISVDLNLEMAATEEMLSFALQVNPHSICVVPEKREERTTEGGLDLSKVERQKMFQKIADQAKKQGILVSFFIEPDLKDIDQCVALGVGAVELHTGSLCNAIQKNDVVLAKKEWARVEAASIHAHDAGLLVHAGHGIDYEIASQLVNRAPHIIEYNIGHAIVCHSVFVGIKESTRLMRKALGH